VPHSNTVQPTPPHHADLWGDYRRTPCYNTRSHDACLLSGKLFVCLSVCLSVCRFHLALLLWLKILQLDLWKKLPLLCVNRTRWKCRCLTSESAAIGSFALLQGFFLEITEYRDSNRSGVCVCVCVSVCPNNDFSIKSPLTSTFGRPVNATWLYLGHFRSQDRRSLSRIQIRKQFLGCGCTLRRNVGNLSRSLCSSGHCDPEWRLCRLWISTTH